MSAKRSEVKALATSARQRSREPLIEGFRVHSVGLNIEAGIDQRTWYEFGKFLQQVDYARDWVLGDWLAYGEHAYGSKIYESAARLLGKSPRTWEDYAYIARNVCPSVRSEILPALVHKPVARFRSDPDLQRKLIGIAEQHGLSKAVFEAVIELVLAGKKYEHLLPKQITPVERARLRGEKERESVLRRARKEGSKPWIAYAREQAEGWQRVLKELEKAG